MDIPSRSSSASTSRALTRPSPSPRPGPPGRPPPRRGRAARPPRRPRTASSTAAPPPAPGRALRHAGAGLGGRGRWAADGRSYAHPAPAAERVVLGEDLFTGRVFGEALPDELLNPTCLLWSEPGEPGEPRIHILVYARCFIGKVLVFRFTRFTSAWRTRRIRHTFAAYVR